MNDPQHYHQKLEAQWALGADSAALRASLVFMAIHQLPESYHMGWLPRIIECLDDVNHNGNPLFPDTLRRESPNDLPHLQTFVSKRSSNLSHSLLSRNIADLVAERASLEVVKAVITHFDLMRQQTNTSSHTLGEVIFKASFERFIHTEHFDDLASLMSMEWTYSGIPILDLSKCLLTSEAKAFNYPHIQHKIETSLISERIHRSRSFSHNKQHVNFSPLLSDDSFLTSNHDAWQTIILNVCTHQVPKYLNERDACRELEQLKKLCQHQIQTLKKAEDSLVESPTVEAHPKIMALNRFIKKIDQRWLATAQDYAKKKPALCAKDLVGNPSVYQINLWSKIGLTTVNALEYIIALGQIYIDEPQFANHELTQFDCAFLAQYGQTRLEQHIQQGIKPSGHLSHILASAVFLNKKYTENQILWLSSLEANSSELLKGKPLRI